MTSTWLQRIEAYEGASELDLENLQLTDGDMQMIIERAIVAKQCADLKLLSNKFSSDSMLTLVAALRKNQTLFTLWLPNNRLLDRGARILARFLTQDSTMLSHLSLANTGLTDQGAFQLAQMLRKNNQLVLLRLDENDIGNDGIQAIADALVRQKSVMQEISLSKNTRIDDRCAPALTNLFHHPGQLRYFTMEHCSLSERCKKKLLSINDWYYYFNKSL